MPTLRIEDASNTGGVPLELYYEAFGEPGRELLLSIMGLGAQCVQWDEDYCRLLASHGYYVVRFDNRDIGLSSHLDHLSTPRVFELIEKVSAGESPKVDYTLTDMARDAVSLIQGLGYEQAHIVGASMGGMIAQRLAIHFPERVQSLTSIMSTTGHPSLPSGKREAFMALIAPPPPEREAFIDYSEKLWRVIGSPGLVGPERARKTAGRVFDRGTHPAGFVRQFSAVIVDGSRREALAQVNAPSLVIHGSADPLIPVEGGRDTAEAIRGASLLELPGMGHDLPEPLWETIAEAIAAIARRAPRD
ncbi:MAG: alpha/beta hydrolase [Polyangiaceae bacterium]|nr:alpha/beta hydrolase [Myxococcales bacterium]MCB9583988.1 alpha/beta hydrolase [Polyangiaceae bacterium]MCB9607756.1 alpha/beta hydrolase [Polyangiaceae bacterium]